MMAVAFTAGVVVGIGVMGGIAIFAVRLAQKHNAEARAK